MKIAILSIAHKPKLLNIFIESFKAKNTKNTYDFYVFEQIEYNYTSEVIKYPFVDIKDYITKLDEILNKDYDFIILNENDCFCLRSVEDLLEKIQKIDTWQIIGNVQYNYAPRPDSDFKITDLAEDSYINLDFAILNPKNCCKENSDYFDSLENEDVGYFDRVLLNILNCDKIICPDLLTYSLFQNQKDFSNCYVCRFDDLENHDQIAPTIKFLPQYKEFITKNNLEFDFMENVDYKLSIDFDMDTTYLLWFYELIIGREKCQITVSKN